LRMRVAEVSLGDYVLNGGEAAALVIIEAIVRLVPGVVGNQASLVDESHNDGLLEAPSYTKPEQWRGKVVPQVLLSGNHAAISRWRREQSLRRTAQMRSDLIKALRQSELSDFDLTVLRSCGWTVDDDQFTWRDGSVAD